MYHRGFRGSRRRSGPKPIITTFKKILKFAPASFGAGFNSQFICQGADNISPKQVNATDGAVPTGAILKYFEVQFCATNVVSTPCFVNCTIQYTLSGQAMIDPNVIGGHAQRNQCLHMDLFTIGANQNSTHKFKFKVPKKFQRMREDMDWALVWNNNVTVNNSTQIIYKFQY